MDILFGISGAILGFLLVMTLRLITTFFHEMGHAIPALLFTDKKVEVYVGSYGDISNTLFLVFGRLDMYLKVNIFKWQIGLCRRKGKVDAKWKRALIILGGPIASLIISIPLILNLETFVSNDLLFFSAVVFIGAAVIDLFVNLWPFNPPMKMHDGGIAFSDGFQLRMMLSEVFMPEEYFEFQKLFEEKKYEELISKTEPYIEQNPMNRFGYQFAIESLVQQKEYSKVLDVYTFQKEHIPLEDSDYFTIGKAYKHLDKYDEALQCFKKFHYRNYNNPELINEMAETYISMGNSNEALQSINAIIDDTPNNYPLHLNKGIAQIKMGDYVNAKLSLDQANKMNQEDPNLYFHYGVLFDKLGEKEEAISHLEKAKEMGCENSGLDFILEEVRRM